MRTKNYLAGCAILALAGTVAAATLEREQHQSGVIPLSYDLLLAPDADNLQFHGQVRIAVEVKASTSSIVLNADELVLEKAVLDSTETVTAILIHMT